MKRPPRNDEITTNGNIDLHHYDIFLLYVVFLGTCTAAPKIAETSQRRLATLTAAR